MVGHTIQEVELPLLQTQQKLLQRLQLPQRLQISLLLAHPRLRLHLHLSRILMQQLRIQQMPRPPLLQPLRNLSRLH